MSPIAILPVLAGFLCGTLFFPVLSCWSRLHQRKETRKRELQRLKNTTFILSGTLIEQNLINHIRSLCHLERQGVLHIITGRRKGYLLFRDGEIIDGFYRNRFGIEGLREIIALSGEGEYYFESRQVLQPNLIRKSLELILQEEHFNE